jgi:hypothetical protein
MIAKPEGKPRHNTVSTISLLPIQSTILLLQQPTIIENIPSHQFGFRKKYGTIQQAHRLVNKTHDLESKRYCSAAFINIGQAFDKRWHTGLLYKIKRAFPHPAYTILKSYLTDRTFQVRYQEYITMYTIQSAWVFRDKKVAHVLQRHACR